MDIVLEEMTQTILLLIAREFSGGNHTGCIFQLQRRGGIHII